MIDVNRNKKPIKEAITSGVIMNKANELKIAIKNARKTGRGEEVDAMKAGFSKWLSDNGVNWKTSPYAIEVLEESVSFSKKYNKWQVKRDGKVLEEFEKEEDARKWEKENFGKKKNIKESIISKYIPQLKAINKSIHSIIQTSAGTKLNSTAKESIDALYAAYHNLKQTLLQQKEEVSGVVTESTLTLKAQGKNPITDAVELKEEAPTDDMNVEQLAKLHLENEKKINDLDAQIKALVEQKNTTEKENTETDEKLLKLFGTTKTKAEKFGNILVDFKVTRDTYITRDSFSYKKILDKIIETYDIETKFINKLYKEFNNGGITKTDVNKELTITQESKQLKESFSLKSIWNTVIGTFKEFFKSYSNSVDSLEKEIANM